MITPNPFPKYIMDDSSGERVLNQRYEDWEQGYYACKWDSDIPKLQCIVTDLEDYWKNLGIN